mmetsp:Transcript_74139/g.230993  ORF Transcript_74139/g.230993 Transcript_74139/m.230993 type:complete len:108 (-) Transcript_74139:132-455(-)
MKVLGKALLFLVLAGAPDGGLAAREQVESHDFTMAAEAEGAARVDVEDMGRDACCQRTKGGSTDYCRPNWASCDTKKPPNTELILTAEGNCGSYSGSKKWTWTAHMC